MASTYRAHIFKQRQVGEREEVRIKFFNADGTPLELTGTGGSDPAPPSTPVNPWVAVGPSTQQGTTANAMDLGDELFFEVGANGLVIVHASIEAWHPPSSLQLNLKLDAGTPQEHLVGTIPVNQSIATKFSLLENGLASSADLMMAKGGVLMILTPGVHTLQFSTPAGVAGGFVRRAVLAAMAVGADDAGGPSAG